MHGKSLGTKSSAGDKELDYDNMNDDDIDNILAQLQSGEYNSGSEENDGSDTIVDGSSDNSNSEDELSNEDIGDTEQNNDENEDSETNDLDDGQGDDTEGEGSEDDAENNQDTGDGKDGNDVEEGSADEGSQAAVTNSDGSINPEEFERYKKFYEELANAEFVANGKVVKGFTDPKKLIQSQQMSYGFSNKMAEIKKYRPFLSALKEKGVLDDEAKFNDMMNLLDADKGAIKTHLSKHNISAVELELDDVEYKPKNYVANKASVLLGEVFDKAQMFGYDEKLRTVLSEQWDEASFKEFIDEPKTRNDLVAHIQDGTYDVVMNKVNEMEMFDTSGRLSGVSTADKYRMAYAELRREFEEYEASRAIVAQRQQTTNEPSAVSVKTVQPSQVKPELDAATKAKLEAEYRAKVEQKNLEAAEARKKAASVSKKKVVVTSSKKFDPLDLEGDELDSFVDSLIMSGRK